MDNKTFATAVTKFFYYANNWDHKLITWETISGETRQSWLPGFFSVFPKHLVDHLVQKFNEAYDRAGCRGALLAFYAELDSDIRASMLKYINENYNYTDGFGISLKSLED